MGLFEWLCKPKPAPTGVRRLGAQRRTRGVITVDTTELWRRQNWVKKGNCYEGWYRTRFGAWQGRIERRGDIFKPTIFDPPVQQLKKHPRWVCFGRIKGKWWRIHLAINPAGQDVDSVLFNVERILDESFLKG